MPEEFWMPSGAPPGFESNGRAAVVTTILTRSFEGASSEDRRVDLLPEVPFDDDDDSPTGIRSSRTSEERLRAFFSKNAKRFHLDDAMFS